MTATSVFPNRTDCVNISVSIVRRENPPTIEMTPKDVKQYVNTSAAEELTALRMFGHTMCANVCRGDAPNVAADSSYLGLIRAQRGLTIRNTTATLNTTCAQRIEATPVRCDIASTPAATTMEGNTNGAVSRPRHKRAPGN